eukprot:gene15943-11410_t
MLVRWRRVLGTVLRQSTVRSSYSSTDESSSKKEQTPNEDVSMDPVSSVVKVRPVLSGFARSVYSLRRTVVASVSNEFYPLGDVAVADDHDLETAPPPGHIEMSAEEEAPLP